MTIYTAIQSIRTWGVRGILNYALRWPTLYKLHHTDKSHGRPPTRGLTLIGPFSAHSGNAMTMRNFARRLKDAGIPFQTFDMCTRSSLPPDDYADILTPWHEFDLGKYDHVIELFTAHAPKSPLRTHAILAFWEFDEGFSYAFPDSVSGAPLIAMSDFNVNTFRTEAPKGIAIFKIPHPLVLTKIASIPHKKFTVFFNFDYGSSYYRKNPESVLRAFAAAFVENENVRLVLKTSNEKNHPETAARLHALVRELKVEDKVQFVGAALSQSEMDALFASCDVYISLHRGEGFGIGMAQAMALGKPVIASNCTANTEFCRPDNSILIPCHRIKVQPGELDNPAYRQVKEWDDPDVAAASDALRRLYQNPLLRKELGDKGRSFIREHFSLENFKSAVNQFLDVR